MLLCHIDAVETHAHFLRHPAWAEALAWIRRYAADAAGGVYPLRGDALFVNVHGYATIPREQAQFESHRRYVDLQYCIRGGENILWRHRSDPPEVDSYDPARDVRKRPVTPPWSELRMMPGLFAVFFPEDEHAPKVRNGVDDTVWKLVVKAETALFG